MASSGRSGLNREVVLSRVSLSTVAALALTLGVTACATGGAGDVPSTNTEPATTTTAVPVTSTTTTTMPTTTTMQATTTSTTAATTTTAQQTTDGASGSGCAPGPGPLPDGFWFGFVTEASASSITFDLACWFEGEAAVTASAEDGQESPPPNDYYVRNENPLTREVAVSPTANASWYLTGDPNSINCCDFGEWVAARAETGFQLGVWLSLVKGEITDLEEQWVP